MLLLNLFLLGTSRIRALVQGARASGDFAGVHSVVLLHQHLTLTPADRRDRDVLLKGVGDPGDAVEGAARCPDQARGRAVRRLHADGAAGGGGHGDLHCLRRAWSSCRAHSQTLIVPAAFSTVLTGFLLLTTRIKAITQVLGYLVLENGIFMFGMLLLEAMPFLVEVGVLLDLFVGVFVMGIIIHHINREFASIDTRTAFGAEGMSDVVGTDS